MADKKISELTSASALAGTEVLPIVQSGETKKLALNAITTLGTVATGTWQATPIANAYIATLTTAGKVANSATTATNANTASTIVARDASGNFSAGTITASLSGNATTATTATTATSATTASSLSPGATINGVSFTGSSNITVAAAAGTLTGATLASGVTASSLTSVGTIATGTWQGSQIADTYLATISTAGKVANSATTATTSSLPNTLVERNSLGNTAVNSLAATSISVSGTTTFNTKAYAWPSAYGTNGQVLTTDTSGNLSWTTVSGGGGTTTNSLTAGSFLTGGTFDGSTAVTFAVDATSANTVSKVVARDASGNFSAGTITAALTGNASTATALQTARTINSVSFDGTANITVAAAASTLTGTTLASGVTASSLTSVGTLSSLAVSGTTALNGVTYTWPATAGTNGQVLGTNGSGTLSWINAGGGGGGGTTTFPLTAGSYLTGGTFDGSTAVTFAVDATTTNTASKVVARDANGDFAASVITATGFQLNTTTAATANIGRIRWDAGYGVPEVRLLGGNVDLAIGESRVSRVLNNTGSSLTLGQVVYITGASGQRATVALADAATEATSTNVIGFVAETIANNQEGFVYTAGTIEGLNTFAFNEGDLLYLSAATPGGVTNVRPTQPNHGVRIGFVVKKSSTDGHIYIDVNNGYELDELHDVLITAPAANNMIRRNAGNTLWVNIAGPAGDVVGTTDSQTLTNKTISGASNTLSSIGNSSLTNSSVTVNGTSIALGASGTITAATSNALTLGSGLTGTSFNGSAAVTATVDSATASTASKIVARDANGSSSFKNVKLDGTTSGTVTVQPAATAGTWSMTLPTGAGTNGQVLTTDGAGVTSWSSAASGGVTLAATTTNATFYPLIYNASTGTTSTLNVDTGWTFNPASNVLTLPGALNMSGKDLTMGNGTSNGVISHPVMFKTLETYGTATISAGTLTLDLNTGALAFRVTRNANISTLTISNPPISGASYSFTLIFDANGTSYTITWPAAVKWPGGTAPTITTTASRSDMFVFYTNNGGTTWYAMTAAQNFVTT